MRGSPSYVVVAVAPSGAEKIVAEKVGGVRAARLANEIAARGFKAEVRLFMRPGPTIQALKD